jgi:hypothetical protein
MPAINTKTKGDSGFIAFYKGKRVEVYGKSLLSARDTVQRHFKAKKGYEINIMVAEKPDGSPVVHTADF